VSHLLVPPLEDDLYPTLGLELAAWLEDALVFGPGDMLGEPFRLTDELVLFLCRAYEVFPRGHPRAGRRRFKRCTLSRRKGVGKTELAAAIAIAELHPQAPVRADGWHKIDGLWVPVGRGVRDPYIPMVATIEDQADELAYGAAKAMLTQDTCPIGSEFDVGEQRITPIGAPGKIEAVASAPNARDGARTTFQHLDETHLFVQTRLKKTAATMGRNLAKRLAADPWQLSTTTAYAPGEDSIAEGDHRYAIDVLEGRADGAGFLFDHRQADERPLTTKKAIRSAVREAAGDAWPFTDIDAIVGQFDDPEIPESEWRRYWLNQPRKLEQRWIDPRVWDELEGGGGVPAERARVVLGLDGSYSRDCTALVGATVAERPHVFVVAVWERPAANPGWRVPRTEVLEAVDGAMARWRVDELAADPPGWHRELEELEQKYGAPPVVRFETNQPSRMGPACDEFYQAVFDSRITHDGDPVLRRHIGNAVKVQRRGYEVLTKSAPDSPAKIDAAVAAVVATHRAMWHASQPTRGEPAAAWV
jgi:phage terminase large subunit-like protein